MKCPYCLKGQTIKTKLFTRCDRCCKDIMDYNIQFFKDLEMKNEIERVFFNE